MEGLSCPRCRKDFVRRYRSSGRWHRLLSVAGIRPFRCQLCGHRFTAFAGAEEPADRVALDRREYVRVATRIATRFSWDAGEGEGSITDLSIAGCSLETEAPVTEGTLLRLSLEPDPGSGPIIVEAAVVRHAGPWRIGVQFLRIQDRELDGLREYLHARARRQPAIADRPVAALPDTATTPQGPRAAGDSPSELPGF